LIAWAPARAAAPRPVAHPPLPRIVIGASVAAACLAAVSVTNAASQGPTAQQREIAQQIFARQGWSITIPADRRRRPDLHASISAARGRKCAL